MLCACALLAGQASAGVIFVDPFDDMQSMRRRRSTVTCC